MFVEWFLEVNPGMCHSTISRGVRYLDELRWRKTLATGINAVILFNWEEYHLHQYMYLGRGTPGIFAGICRTSFQGVIVRGHRPISVEQYSAVSQGGGKPIMRTVSVFFHEACQIPKAGDSVLSL